MVKKKDGTWRPCRDFCSLNLVTTEDKYPLPNMANNSSRLNNCKIFPKLDLQKGYLQVPVREEEILKMAFWFVRIHTHALLSQKYLHDFTKNDGPDLL
jgi:hypothetical protein